ncbi:unnamed protein product [Litomosoides sigmodontis]|uniref:Uncharacterized protein n=1 Tax=Litomosoides sigmodontis TaxID=42156 RepID=A0A3P6V4C5_LITSI|nr:unnamed protein product [Litomosoides sigmodontis]
MLFPFFVVWFRQLYVARDPFAIMKRIVKENQVNEENLANKIRLLSGMKLTCDFNVDCSMKILLHITEFKML